MKKKNKLIMIIGICIILFVDLFMVLKIILFNNLISNLEKYSLLSNEIIQKEFEYKNYKYVITGYYDDASSYEHHNILLKHNDKYYILDTLNKCDMSSYIKDNEIYIHCIGNNGDIIKYTINETIVDKDIIEFDYANTPNISQIHITIDKVDNGYIYLSSVVKNIDSIKDGNKVKCSLKTKICIYD